MSISDDSLKFRHSGMNCAQSVVLSTTDIERNLAVSVSAGFGGGMKTGDVCGCISGAYIALGYNGVSNDKYIEFIEAFKNEFGYTRCRDLKANGISCDELIKFSAEAVERILKNGNL